MPGCPPSPPGHPLPTPEPMPGRPPMPPGRPPPGREPIPGRLPALESNFRNHNVAYLKKHGIESVGYWTPQDSPFSENTLIFIVAHDSREAAERERISEALEQTDWNVSAAARLLNIERTNLHKRMRALGLSRG